MLSRRTFLPAAIAAAAILAAAGCDLLAPGWSRRPGLVMEGTPPMTSLVAPDAVTRGTPFQITVSTFGSGSCTRPDRDEVTSSALEFEVLVYDEKAPSGTACTADLRRFPRTLTVQFDQAGTAEIRVVGRGEGADGRAPRTVRKTVTVQ
jgi:hypothetical protein